MSSFTLYDPKTKVFRALETADSIDLPFDQVMLINIFIELRVISALLGNDAEAAMDAQDWRESVVQEI